MTVVVWLAILIACAASIAVAYLVAADFWRDGSSSSRDRIVDITRDAHDATGRLAAMYQQALKDMRRR